MQKLIKLAVIVEAGGKGSLTVTARFVFFVTTANRLKYLN